MNRRHLLKLLAMGLVSHTLDIDKLLWLPGEKTIFLPPKGISLSEIMNIEMQRIVPKLQMLFERDDMFFKTINRKHKDLILTSAAFEIPLKINEEF